MKHKKGDLDRERQKKCEEVVGSGFVRGSGVSAFDEQSFETRCTVWLRHEKAEKRCDMEALKKVQSSHPEASSPNACFEGVGEWLWGLREALVRRLSLMRSSFSGVSSS